MSRQGMTVAAVAGAALLWFFLPAGQAESNAIEEVFVTNFPRVQEVQGAVRVDGPVHLAQQQVFRDIIVPPVERSETTRLIDAGTLEANGFPSVILSLHGAVKGAVQRKGSVGALLVPDEPTIQEALNERGLLYFPLETVAAGITIQTPYFGSDQPRFAVAFPRYRVLLYNTTDKTVTANVFAYLTN